VEAADIWLGMASMILHSSKRVGIGGTGRTVALFSARITDESTRHPSMCIEVGGLLTYTLQAPLSGSPQEHLLPPRSFEDSIDSPVFGGGIKFPCAFRNSYLGPVTISLGCE